MADEKISAVETVVSILKQSFADRCQTGHSVREQHGHTTTWLENQPPDAVVFAQSTQEVSEIVRVCATHKVPVIPFGAGTSLEGHLNAYTLSLHDALPILGRASCRERV